MTVCSPLVIFTLMKGVFRENFFFSTFSPNYFDQWKVYIHFQTMLPKKNNPHCSWQVTWTWRGSSWWTATQSVWIGCVSATTAVRRWSWRRRRTWRPQSVCSGSSCRSSPSQLSRQRSRGTYCSYTKVCVHLCTFHSLCSCACSFFILCPSFFSVGFQFI